MDAMAEAVENCYCFLMCVTEKYRQSEPCQAEAKYANRLKKPIIPLLMQAGFENASGWLGIIMGDKIFVNFEKYPYEWCIEKIKKEIDAKLNKNNVSAEITSSVVSGVQKMENMPKTTLPLISHDVAITSNSKSTENWSDKEVNEYFVANNVDKTIIDAISPCDGQILKQLNYFRLKAPEFYVQILNTNKSANNNSMAILKFSYLLEKLFS